MGQLVKYRFFVSCLLKPIAMSFYKLPSMHLLDAGAVFLAVSNRRMGSAATNPYAYQDVDEVIQLLLTAAVGRICQDRCYFTQYDALTVGLARKAQALMVKFRPKLAAAVVAAAGSLPFLAITAGVAAALSNCAEQLTEYGFTAVREAAVLGEAKEEAAWKELVLQLAVIELMVSICQELLYAAGPGTI